MCFLFKAQNSNPPEQEIHFKLLLTSYYRAGLSKNKYLRKSG